LPGVARSRRMDLNMSAASARSTVSVISEGGGSTKMPHQWERNTRVLVDSARKAQSLSTQQRNMSFGVQKGTEEVVVQDHKTSDEALNGTITVCNQLKSRVEEQLESILKEAVLLEEEAARATSMFEKMKEPLAMAEECLALRKKRPPRELTRDAVERALNEQVAGAKHALRMLGGVLDAASKELARLRVCRERLEEDADQKRLALEVDMEALGMDSGWANGGYKQRVGSFALPHAWRSRTEALCEECERVRATSERLRGKSLGIQGEAAALERGTREALARALRRKMDELERLQGEVAAAGATMGSEMDQMEEARASVERSIADKMGPLSLAKSRLTVRTSKPGSEAVRDTAERSLEKEVADLEQAIRKLSLEIARQTSDIKRLEVSKAQLDSDFNDKTEALAIETECAQMLDELSNQMGAFLSAAGIDT